MGEGPPKIKPAPPEELLPVAPSEGLASPSAPEAMPPKVSQELIPAETDEVSVEASEEFSDLPKEGEVVTLTKQSINEGADSARFVGGSFSGALLAPIEIGRSVNYGALQTSPVKAISRGENGKFRIETATSVYELEPGKVSPTIPADAVESENQTEGSVEKLPEMPKAGERVVIQKVSENEAEVQASRREGTLGADVVEGAQLFMISNGKPWSSSNIKKAYVGGRNKFYIETVNSTYEILRV